MIRSRYQANVDLTPDEDAATPTTAIRSRCLRAAPRPNAPAGHLDKEHYADELTDLFGVVLGTAYTAAPGRRERVPRAG